jgi:two-component system chemotaxis response regulator CheB
MLSATKTSPAGTPPAIVAIGASAGAIEALSVLLPTLPTDLAIPVLVVVHLPRNLPSILPEVLARVCRLPVREPADKVPIEPGVVWIAPPDYHVLVDADATFALSVEPPVHFSRPSVDVLFESIAPVYGASAVAIVLTGANADGADGAAAIRATGGTVLVQRPDLAYASAMPLAAIARAAPQFVGELDEIAAHLAALLGGVRPIDASSTEASRSGAPS